MGLKEVEVLRRYGLDLAPQSGLSSQHHGDSVQFPGEGGSDSRSLKAEWVRQGF